MPLYQISSGTCPVSIACPSTIAKDLRSSIFTAIIKSAQQPAAIHYQVTNTDGKYRLFRNGRLTHRNKAVGKILYALEWQIVNDWVRHLRHGYLLHGAALAWHEQGYLFLGGSGTGKTSFSLFLMQHGFQLLSDEFACLQPPQFSILPFPRNIVIKSHLLPFIDPLKIPPEARVIRMIKEGLVISPTLWGKVCLRIIPLSKIFVLSPKPHDKDYTLAPLTQSTAVMHLVFNAFNPQQFKPNLPATLSAIAQRAQLFFIESPNPLALSPQHQKNLIQDITR